MNDYRSAIMQQVLRDCSAQTILCLDQGACELLKALNCALECSILKSPDNPWQAFSTRYDLAVLSDSTTLSPASLRPLLACARDLLAAKVLAFLKDTPELRPDALGYTLLARPEPGLSVWTYDILTYKQVPDWLNARFWANPQNWNRYRW